MTLLLACTVLLPLATGAALVRLLGVRFGTDRLAFLGWSWIAGCMVTALVVFAWLWTAPDVTAPLLPTAVIAGIGLLASLWRRDAPRTRAAAPTRTFAKVEELAFAAAVAFAVFVTAEWVLLGTLQAMVTGDETQFWVLKSKVLFASNGFTDAFAEAMSDPMFKVDHKDYPLLNPLLQLFAFAHAGEITHVVNRLPIQMFALAQVLILAAAARRAVRPGVAALIVLAVLGHCQARVQAASGEGDLMVGLGAVVALDGWLRFHSDRSGVWLRVVALGLALTAWAKNEGLLYVVCVGVAAFLSVATRPRVLRDATRAHLWLVLPALFLGLTAAFNSAFGFESAFGRHEGGSLVQLFFKQFDAHAGPVLEHFATQIVVRPDHSNLVLACFLGMLLCFPIALWRSPLRLPALAILGGLAGIMAVFVGTPAELGWHLQTAASRVAIQVVPVAALWVAAAAGSLFPALALRSDAARVAGDVVREDDEPRLVDGHRNPRDSGHRGLRAA